MVQTRIFMISLGLAAMLACSFARAAEDGVAEVSHGAEVSAEHVDDHGHADPHGGDSHGEGGLNNPLEFDPDLAIVTAIVFLVLMAILWKFAWGPISEALDAREKSVADNIAAAAQQHEEAKRLLAEHQSQLSGTADQVKQMLDEARRDAETIKAQLLSEGQQAAEQEKERALRAIDAARDSALQSLAEKSVDTAVSLAGRIVNRQLSSEDQAKLISEALEKFPSKN